MKSNNLMMLVLLIFASQVSSVPLKKCTMTHSSGDLHRMMNVENMQSSDIRKVDCSGEECDCLSNMFLLTLFLLPSKVDVLYSQNDPSKKPRVAFFIIQQFKADIFYPPILS